MRLLAYSARSLSRRGWLPASCVATVALGVSLTVSTRLADASLRASHERFLSALSGGADLVVRSGAGMPPPAIDAVEAIQGVKAAAPSLSVETVTDGPGGAVRVFGIDPIREARLGRFLERSAPLAPEAMRAWAMRTDGVIAAGPCAERLGLSVGSTLRVGAARGTRVLVVRGVVDLPLEIRPYASGWLFMEISAAQILFGRLGRIDRIDVALDPGADAARVREAIREAVPGAAIETAAEASHDAWAAIEGFRSGLVLISLLGLGVGAYLVGGTLAYLASERSRELSILRAVGATRARIFRLLVTEGALLGAVGSVLGAALGWGLAETMMNLLGRAYSLSIVRVEGAALRLDDPLWPLAILLGTAVSAAASVLPAAFASRAEAPGEIARLRGETRSRHLPLRTLGGSGTLLLVACLVLYLRPSLLPGYAGHAMTILFTLAAGGIVPAATLWTLRILRAGAPGRSLALRLAADGLLRAPGRTSVTVLVLTLVVGMTVGSAVTARGFRNTIGRWLDTFAGPQLQATTAESYTNVRSFRPVPEEVFLRLEGVPGIAAVVPLRFAFVPYAGGEVMILAGDLARNPGLPRMALTAGDLAEAVGRMRSEDAVVASENFCARSGVRLGDEVELPTPRGPVRFRIVARAIEYGWPDGTFYMDRARYAAHWGDPLADAATLLLERGADGEQVKREALRALGGVYPIRIFSWDEYQGALLTQIDEFLRIQHVQTLLSGVVGLFAIFISLAIAARTRAREFALLRAAGTSRAALARILRAEGFVLVGLGLAFGLPVGALAYLPAVTLARQQAGYGFEPAFPPDAAALAVAVAIVATWLASIGPVRRIVRLSVGRTLAPE